MFDNQKAILDKLEGNDKESPAQAIDENMFLHAAIKSQSLPWVLPGWKIGQTGCDTARDPGTK